MSSQESKKSAAKFGGFKAKKPSGKFTVPKLTKPKEEAPAVSVDAKPEPKPRVEAKAEERAETSVDSQTDHTEELPEDELLDESDLEELDDDDVMMEGELEGEPVIKGVASGSIDTAAVDPYAATQALGADDVAALQAHKAAADAASANGVVAGVLGSDLPGISADPLAAPMAQPSSAPAPAPARPVTNEAAEAAAAVAALDGLDDSAATVENSMQAQARMRQQQQPPMQSQPQTPMAPGNTGPLQSQPQMPMAPGNTGPLQSQPQTPMAPGNTGPFQAAPAPQGPSSSGPFPAVHTPYPGYAPTPLPQQAPQMYTPTPLPQQAPPPDPMAAAAPAPGTMEAARQASWKRAHPSARRWAKKRDAHSGSANRRTPQPLRIGAGLLLIGIGIYLLAIFVPAHSPDGSREAEKTEAGKVWRFSETQHGVASGLAFGLVGLGLFGMLSGAFYRREITAHCRECQMKVEATREGLSLRCHNGGHKAGLDKSSVGMLAAFVIVGSSTLVLLLTASLG